MNQHDLPESTAAVEQAADKVARIVVITSGKGGVGKTTTAASFAAGLALRGHKTAVIDFDVGLRNLDLIMGCERRVVYDLVNVIHGEATLNQALIRDKNCNNLFVLPASQTRDKEALTQEGVENVLNGLKEMGFEFIICDSPAGIETGALLAMHYADEALIVRVKPPRARYWAVEFGNYWWSSMDYRNRLCGTNCHYAALEDDGELILVVSHVDPGVANWIDPSGFAEGYMTIRWMLADHYPQPQGTQVKLAELERHLPATTKRVTPAARAAW